MVFLGVVACLALFFLWKGIDLICKNTWDSAFYLSQIKESISNIESDIADIRRNTDPKEIEWRNTPDEWGNRPKDFGF